MIKSNYWSCSTLANWIRGTPKPASGTTEDWAAWEKMAKKKGIRYWLAEEGLDHLQNTLFWPFYRLNELRFYINNRWVIKSHALTSTLKRGQWHDLDTRLLHANFDELVNFVEIEQAWMYVVFSKEERQKYKVPWYRTIFRISLWRSPAAGIAYLEWAAGLKMEDNWCDKNDPGFGQPTSQALAAKETLALYKWWKDERPKRPEPIEASGWGRYCEENPTIFENNYDSLKNEMRRDLLNACYQIEKEQQEEDTMMLIRLIKIRKNLWT